MLAWHASELHTHTRHSDGQFTVAELMENSVAAGYETVALTDHNTTSGLAELPEAARRTGLRAIRGLEWSSYHGHMVTHGCRTYIPWHDIGLDDIHTAIARVHEAGGIAGVAHPFTIGEPFCLGCRFHFHLKDWSHPDYIEVWNEQWPSLEYSNIKAFDLWTEKLDQGCRIFAASGRDWHGGSGQPHEAFPLTYVGVEDDRLGEDYEAGWLDGMRKGRISVSFGPLPRIGLVDGARGLLHLQGDSVDRRTVGASADIDVSVDFERRKGVYAPDDEDMTVQLAGNTGLLWKATIGTERQKGLYEARPSVDATGLRWVRCELYGSMRGRRQTVAFTNPIFIG